MDRWVGKVAIVTGASSGIGKATVTRLSKAGMIVVGLARRVEPIESLTEMLRKSEAKGRLYPLKCDLQIEEDILKAFEWTTKNLGNVHVLVNNAGIAANATLSQGNTEDWRNILETNVLGLCIAIREAVNIMKTNNIEGQIIHINSILGQSNIFYPTIGVYGASKHAVGNITEMLRQELFAAKSSIKVSCISPGLVRTELFTDKVSDQVAQMMKVMPALESDDIVDGVMFMLSVPHRVHINDLIMRPINSNF